MYTNLNHKWYGTRRKEMPPGAQQRGCIAVCANSSHCLQLCASGEVRFHEKETGLYQLKERGEMISYNRFPSDFDYFLLIAFQKPQRARRTRQRD